MKLTKDVKSKVLTNLVQNVPGILSMKGLDTLVTDPEKAIFGFEDAVEAQEVIKLTEENKQDIEQHFDSTSLKDLFPNARLSAELEIVKQTDRNKYDEFTNKIFELEAITKEIDAIAGPNLDFLLDEIKQVANPEAIDAVKNLGVSIINVEDGKVADK